MSSSCDYYSERTVRGRRAYVCSFAGCRKPIAKGAEHVCVSIGANGSHSTHRGHLECFAVAAGYPAPARETKTRPPADSARNPIFSAP